MRIFRDEPLRVRVPDSNHTFAAGTILYWLLRGFTVVIAISLALTILAAVLVSIPFYASEGYTLQFQDRIFSLIGDCLLFIAIVIPHQWTLTWRSLIGRCAIILLPVLWIVVVDAVAFYRGLSTMLFTPHSGWALSIAMALLATLAIQFERRR